MGNMTDVHSLDNQGLAKFHLNASYGDMETEGLVVEEVRRRWPYLAGSYDNAQFLLTLPNARAFKRPFGAMMERYAKALERIMAGEDPASVFASMDPVG